MQLITILILIMMSLPLANNINYYNDDEESFANVITNNFTFKCRVSGLENSGEAVILLHGFPETSRMWSDLMKLLSSNGFRVIAPDQRGYSEKARPKKIEDYRIDKLSDDVIEIANAFEFNSFHLIGHDWGSAVGWYLASKKPDKILSWTALSVPHLDAFFDAINSDKEQQKKSQYISFFRMPILPELYFKIFGYRYLKNIWTKSSSDEIEKYLEVFTQRGALSATLNWYRANLNDKNQRIGDIYIPTLIIYGINDMAIGERSVLDSEKYLKGSYKIERLDYGHWLIQESFDIVSENILDHIKKY